MEGRSVRGSDALLLEKREVPMIRGSSAAFIAIVVVLVLFIISACIAAAYLLREDLAASGSRVTITAPQVHDDEEALARGPYQRQGSGTGSLLSREPGYCSSKPSRGWGARILGFARSKNHRGGCDGMSRAKGAAGARPHSVTPSRQGWMQAGNESDWDIDSAEEQRLHERTQNGGSLLAVPRSGANNNTSMRMAERHDSTGSFSGGAYSATPLRMYSSDSASSVVRFDADPHAIRGLAAYADTPSRHGGPVLAPSIHSPHQYYASPPSSPTSPSSPSPAPSTAARPQQQLPSRMTMNSPEAIERSSSEPYPSHNYVLGSHSPFPAPSPSIRTFGSGSRFVEAL